jgi:hypothetical protein
MEGKEKTFVTYMINGLQRIDYLIGRLSLPLEPIPLTLQLRNMFICSGTTLFTRERVYLVFTISVSGQSVMVYSFTNLARG